MSIITAYKCDSDGKIFEDKTTYQKHLRKLAQERLNERKVQAHNNQKIQFLQDEFWNKVKSLAQLKVALLKHAEFFGMNGSSNYHWYKSKPKDVPLLKKIEAFDLRFSDSVSNSHCCPHNGVENWGGKVTLKDGTPAPRGYPGFSGRIDYLVEWLNQRSHEYPGGSEMWKGTRIHSGTGGGGGFVPYDKKDKKGKGLQHFGYSISIFLDDWPAMKETYETVMTLNILKYGHTKFDVIKHMDEMHPAEEYI